MTIEIQKELKRLETQHHIKILYAVESGSRAWGFASTDSDWDVRFIYIHPLDWYLQIDTIKDSIEEILPSNIDLAGWELKKALKLFRKSNPPMLEWLRSPIIYLEQYSTANQLQILTQQYFNPKSCLHHYLHMAEGNYREYLQRDIVRTKKYLYVLRPILACRWIYQTQTMPPMEFLQLLNTQLSDKEVKQVVDNLLIRKMSGKELNEEPKIEVLNNYLDREITFFREYIRSLPSPPQPHTSALNQLFQQTINEAWKPSFFIHP